MSYLVNGRKHTGSAPCFYCDKKVALDERRIEWAGTTRILLHVHCALSFAHMLLGDLVAAKERPLQQVGDSWHFTREPVSEK